MITVAFMPPLSSPFKTATLPARLQPRCSHGWELQIKEEHTFRGPIGLGGNELTGDLCKNPAKVNKAPSHRTHQEKSRDETHMWGKKHVFRVLVCNSHSWQSLVQCLSCTFKLWSTLKEPNVRIRTHSCLLRLKADSNTWEIVIKYLYKCMYFTFPQPIKGRLVKGRMQNARSVNKGMKTWE